MAGIIPDLNDDMGFFAQSEEGRSYLVRVQGSAHSPLSDGELAEVLNWMLRTFAASESPEPLTEAEVSASRHIPMPDVMSVRKRLLEGRFEEEATPDVDTLSPEQEEAFGEAVFFDASLSKNNNQSCATCHDPGRAFSDARPGSIKAGASFGSNGESLGLRNAPALTYLALTPSFTRDEDSSGIMPTNTPADAVRGGFFWDGRKATLESQVLTPFVNRREMALTDMEELAARVARSPLYSEYLGTDLDHNEVLLRIARGLAAYLRSDPLNSFDSRYDRYLRGELEATREESLGMQLFFAPSFTNCASCHQSEPISHAGGELFTNHRYENIGTPVNKRLIAGGGKGSRFRDPGLADNPMVNGDIDASQLTGRFKVPSLRNVAVTGPYMHNGIFSDLSTVMTFYNHFNESGNSGQINPETGQPWQPAPYAKGVARDKLSNGFPLNKRQISALTAFLRMLTDKRYESLLL